jgi:transcriptional regulator GlxA family with amidase domain
MIRRRIQRAATLLSESSLTISQIADAMGYRDVYFFSRQFKQKMGQSPRTYRSGPTLAESHESQPRR